ncbi:MAG: dynamin family protein [Verrucomicrobia bacterium]|nr:dynamin family protein [Verrucomicrobiota bacterium]
MSTAPSSPSIKTDIFEFCQAFAGLLKPFAKSLEAVRAGIQGKGDAEVLQRPMAGFSDVHIRLESLIDKVEEQQAYLIIFGPLKSGKSTLMNAISAAYVSEVTSLPAYPCLVHVKHGDDYSFVASRYSGEKLRFSDNAALQALIKQSHQTLAVRLREVEEQGEKFDPGVHYPDAIRRVDVALPTRNLKDSLTVLVDTPGLYTRMKFGYDLMTREFRNSAACAVFVVKTDNLFLEQVFEEFNQLLGLFSRIFLVVNIDTNKRDLDPDGSLQPSLESKSPGEVIRAFESLVMSAPLRRAQDEGRLKIYPIDLLNSASAAMKRAVEAPQADEVKADEAKADEAPAPAADESPAADDEAAASAAAGGEDGTPADPAVAPAAQGPPALQPLPVVPPASDDPSVSPNLLARSPAFTMPVIAGQSGTVDEAAAATDASIPAAGDSKTSVMPASWAAHPEASFALFLRDLTDYLNSSDYLQEFMGDALLVGTNLGVEIEDHCSPRATASFESCQKILAAELSDTEARLAAVEKFAALDLKASFTPIRDELRKHAEDASRAAVGEAQQNVLKQLDAWFSSNYSVAVLQDNWAALVRSCAKRVGSECHAKVRSLVAGPFGGIRIDGGLRSSAVGLDTLLGPVVEAVRATLGETEPTLQSSPFRIEPEHLKVRKSWWDWLAFRSLAAVRRKLFGMPDEWDHEVSYLTKEKRLGEEGKQALKERIVSTLSQQFPSEALRVSAATLTQYIDTLSKELHDKLQAGKDKYAARKAELTQRIEDNLAIRHSLDELTCEAAGVLAEIDKLRRKYHSYSRVTGALPEMPAASAETPAPEDPPEDDTPPPAPAVETNDAMPVDDGLSEDRDEANHMAELALELDTDPGTDPGTETGTETETGGPSK